MNYAELISPENLFTAFDEFKRGKRKKEDVMNFERNLEKNIFELAEQLLSKTYRHGHYKTFSVCDPKYRIISKACVKDRVVHHVLFNYLYGIFDKTFIFHSYSSRLGKGTHLAVKNLHKKMRKASENFTKPCYTLKCDIRKFFASINHKILINLLTIKITDPDILQLAKNIIESYSNKPNIGLPLGNVTSQIFANIYLNELDQFIKHKLKIKYYLRYADDFAIIHQRKSFLENIIPIIKIFLKNSLSLSLHPQKVFIRKLNQGLDFLGYVCLPHYRVLRTKTKKRMFGKISQRKQELIAGKINKKDFNQSLQSYLGILQHANSHKLTRIIKTFM